MKKFLLTLTTLALSLGLALSLAACKTDAEHTIVVGATSEPHAEILAQIKDDVKAQGYTLDIRVYDSYEQLNPALAYGDLDANYFQHTPYLNDYNAENNGSLVAVEKIHYEPLGIYGKGSSTTLTEKTGRSIIIPNDTTNGARALLLLEAEGFITLREGVNTASASVLDIEEDNGNTITEADAALVAAQLNESNAGTLAVINGNYALAAGLNAANALAVEAADGDAAQLYANVIAVRAGEENTEKTRVLLAALKTQKVIAYITATYHGAVLPVFSV